MIVAIDGPAGSGKSSLSRACAKKMGFVYLDTGAMYRALTLYCLQNHIAPTQEEAVEKAAQAIDISFGSAGEKVFLNGCDVTDAIRTALIDENVSQVSLYPRVRKAMVSKQRALAQNQNCIVEGRDIGSVVFPDAEVKIFLSADASARARRRTIEREGGDPTKSGAVVGDKALYEKILKDILKRDKTDKERSVSPLKKAEGSYELDTTCLTLEEAVQKVCAKVKEAIDIHEGIS